MSRVQRVDEFFNFNNFLKPCQNSQNLVILIKMIYYCGKINGGYKIVTKKFLPDFVIYQLSWYVHKKHLDV